MAAPIDLHGLRGTLLVTPPVGRQSAAGQVDLGAQVAT